MTQFNEITEASTDMVVVDHTAESLRDEIVSLSEGRKDLYSSLKTDSFEDKLTLLNAVTNAEKIADAVNVPFNLKDVVIQAIEIADDKTGQMVTVAQVILIDDEGTARYGVSKGLFGSIKTYIKLLGEPSTWPEPIRVVVKREGPAMRQYFTMTLAPKGKK